MALRTTTSLPKWVCLVMWLILSSNCFHSFAQTLGLEPPSTKWRIIKTPYAEIIFEPHSEAKAQRTANIIDFVANRDSSFIGGPAQSVPIILHSQSTFPAGVPNLAPWRSDWSLAAPQDPFMGALLWTDGLTIHEYRHHQQMTQGKHGWFSDLLRVILGQTGWYVGILTVQPNWFFEGDATYAETVLSNGGRGRMPAFDREYRTIRLSGIDYGYEKASRQSRKDFIPNIYREGYYLTSYARKHFGVEIWTRVLNDTYNRKGFFYPFSRSLKSLTGYRTKDLYEEAMLELDSIWEQQDKELILSSSTLISTTPKKVYTDYRFPQYTSTGDIIAEKSSFQQIRTFCFLDETGREKKIFQPGNITPDHVNLALSGDLMTWAENRFHPRWDLKDYSVIFSYDLNSGKKRQVTHKSRYYSPAASSDGEYIVVLELKPDTSQGLVLIDAITGEKLKEFERVQFGQFAYPRFSQDNDYIITGYTDDRGNTIRSIQIETGETTDLLPFSDQIATRPYDHGEHIFFSGTFTGINNIFAVSKTNGEVFQITSSRFGAYMPTVSEDGHKLLFSEYTAMGFEIREMDLQKEKWIPFDFQTPSQLTYYQSLASEEGGSIIGKVSDKIYDIEDFKPLTKGLLKFHSWAPSLDQNEYGIEFIGNSLMSNTSTNLGYRYNFNDNISVTYGKLSYGALFPVIDIGYSYNIRNAKNIFDDQYNSQKYDWRENVLTGGLRFPLRLSSNRYSSILEISAQYDHQILNNDLPVESISQNKSFGAIGGGLQFSRIKSRARQQIQPDWAQTFSIDIRRSFENQNAARLVHVDGSVFFPGLLKTHSFFLKGSFQDENLTDSYRFENQFENARGYQSRYFADTINIDFERGGLVSINYFLPLAFPDLSLGSVAYFQSVSMNPFFDYSAMEINGNKSYMRAVGVDIGFEFTAFRLFQSTLILRGLHRFDLPDPEMGRFLFDVVFEITDLAF